MKYFELQTPIYQAKGKFKKQEGGNVAVTAALLKRVTTLRSRLNRLTSEDKILLQDTTGATEQI